MEFAFLVPQKLIKDRMEKYSPDLFQTSIMGEKMAMLFPDFVENSLKEVSALKRSFLHDILKPEALKQYIVVMDAMAREHLDENWESNAVHI
ncbi:hypothetical protein P3S68_014007 [Capsicum galapagoense]